MIDLRLIGADVLKLRRRRGMLAISLGLTLAAPALIYAVMAIQHAGDPATHGPAGGLSNYQGAVSFVSVMAIVVGAIIGATAGAQDLESGVFRDLAATGRSRTALYGSRVLGAWAVVLPIVGLSAVVAGAGAIAFAGSLAAPSAGALVAGTASVLAAGALSAAAAVGLSALLGSRGPVIGIMLAFNLAIAPLLAQITFLGNARQALPNVALDRIGELPQKGLAVALGTAIAVVLAWALTALAAGAWKTTTREI